MTAYSPASSLGWLDFDAAAADRVATLLRALQEPGTLDVLGLGPVAGTFSGILHPGTSYIHTKARYLLFVPWILQGLEADRVAPGDFFPRLRHDEAQLIDCLRHLGQGQGVIGYQAGRNLKRMPSSIYWGALWDWGIRRLPVGLGEYARRAAAFGRYRAARDDDGNVTDTTQPMWAPIPPPPENFLRTRIDLEMQPDEAQALVDNIRLRHPDTLLASLCATPDLAARYTYPWDALDSALPHRVTEVLHHARCFSELTTGPQHAYNVLVARRAQRELGWDKERIVEIQLDHLRNWVVVIENRREELRSWVDDLPALWEFLQRHRRNPISEGTRNFISTIVEMAVDNPRRVRERRGRSRTNPPSGDPAERKASALGAPVCAGELARRTGRWSAQIPLVHRQALPRRDRDSFGYRRIVLQPTNRLTLIDAMRPPAAFRLESAMAVTFTLNLQALLAAPAAFAITGLNDTAADAVGPRPVELIHALRTNAHKLTVFSEAGQISLPPASRAFAFLEGAVVPVRAPRGGIVHPKVWVLRYEASADVDDVAAGDRRLRVLITSRNLTFDPSWDTVLRLDESPDSQGAQLGAVGELFEGLLGKDSGRRRLLGSFRAGSVAGRSAADGMVRAAARCRRSRCPCARPHS